MPCQTIYLKCRHVAGAQLYFTWTPVTLRSIVDGLGKPSLFTFKTSTTTGSVLTCITFTGLACTWWCNLFLQATTIQNQLPVLMEKEWAIDIFKDWIHHVFVLIIINRPGVASTVFRTAQGVPWFCINWNIDPSWSWLNASTAININSATSLKFPHNLLHNLPLRLTS